MNIERKNPRIMFLLASIAAFISSPLSFLYLQQDLEEVTILDRNLFITFGVISIIVGCFFLVMFFLKEEKTYVKLLNYIKVACFLSLFGSVLTVIFAYAALNRIKTNILIDKGITPNQFFFVTPKEDDEKKDDNVFDVEAQIKDEIEEDKSNESKTMQEQLDELYSLFETGKISEDEFYRRKQVILNKFYGND